MDSAVIALWMGHQDIRSTQVYIHADLKLRRKRWTASPRQTFRPGASSRRTSSSLSSKACDPAISNYLDPESPPGS
ncbi:MAG: hypothetical protein JO345_30870 [Streptosporangiaceae bacterium]|nr:hypothetical protein [Streptosporangiaceae bacterium]